MPDSSAWGWKNSKRRFDLLVQIGRFAVEPVRLGEVKKIVEQVLKPLALALHDVYFSQSPPLALVLRFAKILAEQFHIEAYRR